MEIKAYMLCFGYFIFSEYVGAYESNSEGGDDDDDDTAAGL